ncbi:MAG: hypothetical protein K1X87_00105 [Dehalococcoidia bacterium]|nr:hypothetical protein [Dehalococcoidia bacterium]
MVKQAVARPFVMLVAAGVIVLAGVAVAGAASVWPLKSHQSAGPVASNLNTASQKSVGTTGTFVDVTDNPVSLPSEKTIYPPRTGNAGLATPHQVPNTAIPPLLAATAILLLAARFATRHHLSR